MTRFRRLLAMAGLAACGLISSVSPTCLGAEAGERTFPDVASEFFSFAQVHTVHCVISAAEWDAMEPKRGAPSGPGPGGMGGPGVPATGRPGLAAMMGLEFPFVTGAIEIDGQRLADVGFRYKGNGTYMASQMGDKRPFKVRVDRKNKDQRFRGLTTLNFHNSVFDPSYMRESMGYAVARSAGLPAPRTTYARVYLTITGRHEREYLGLYTVTEQVDESFLANWFGGPGGLLMKPGTRDSFQWRGPAWKDYDGPLNVQQAGTPAEQERMLAFLKVLNEGSDEAFAAWVHEGMNLENAALFLALNVAMSNLDSILGMGQNFYTFVEPKSGRVHWWLWDLDLSWGTFPFVGTPDSRIELSIAEPWQGDNRLVQRLLKVEAFQTRYRAALKRVVEGPMSVASVRARVEALSAALKPAIAEEGPDKWAGFEAAVNAAAGARTAAAPAGGFMGFAGGPPFLEFVERRGRSVLDQLAGRSAGEHLEGMNFGGGPPPGGERRGGPGGPGGRPGGGRGPGGPGGPGGGPGRFLSQPFLQDGDTDKGGDLSQVEFKALADLWYSRWDTNQSGAAGNQQIADGINRNLRPMGMGPGAGPGMRFRTPEPARNPMMGGGPGTFLAPLYVKAGDADADGRLTQTETRALFEKWWKAWDKNQDGKLVADEVGEGMGTLMPPMPGGPGGPGGGPRPQ